MAFEVWETRNGDDICRTWLSSARGRAFADFHLLCPRPDDIVNELETVFVSDVDLVSSRSNSSHRAFPGASWTQHTKVSVSYGLV